MFPECIATSAQHKANEQEHLRGAKAVEPTLGEPLDEGISADGAMHRDFSSVGAAISLPAPGHGCPLNPELSRRFLMNGSRQRLVALQCHGGHGAALSAKQGRIDGKPRHLLDVIAFL
jgi:hypothetical protein